MPIRRHLENYENRKLKFNYIPSIQMRVARHTRPFYYQLEALKRVGYSRLLLRGPAAPYTVKKLLILCRVWKAIKIGMYHNEYWLLNFYLAWAWESTECYELGQVNTNAAE